MKTLEDISQRMKNSGHSDQFMKRILIAGIPKYERKLKYCKVDTENVLYKPHHQPSGRSVKRLKKKTMARENWFKQSDKGWPRLTTWKCSRLESSKPSRRQDRIIDNKRMTEYFKTGMMKQETPGGRKKETKSGTCPLGWATNF